MKRFQLLFLVIIAPVFLRAADQTLPGIKDKWTHYQSPNFEVYSTGFATESREILRKLELLRVVMIKQRKLVETAPHSLTVFYFNRRRDFEAYCDPRSRDLDISSFHRSDPDRARVLLSPSAGDNLEEAVFFSYLYHFIGTSQKTFPAWLSRGLAGVYSSFVEEDKELKVGYPSEWRVGYLGEHEPRSVLFLFRNGAVEPRFKTGEDLGRYASECWLLTHFLLYSKGAIPEGAGVAFIEWSMKNPYASDAEIQGALLHFVKLDFEGLDKALRNYLHGGRYGWGVMAVPELPSSKTYVSRKVPQEEMQLRLAELGAISAGSGAAKLVLLNALSTSQDPRVSEVLGAIAEIDRDEMSRDEYWNKAIAQGTTNMAVKRRVLGRALQNWWVNYSPDFTLLPEKAAELTKDAQALLDANPNEELAYETFAWVNAFSKAPDLKMVVKIQENYTLLVNPDRVLLALATACYKSNKPKDALAFLNFLGKLDADSWVRRNAETLRARIENRQPIYNNLGKSRAEMHRAQIAPSLP